MDRDIDLAWMAGIVDGEGCVTAQPFRSNSRGINTSAASVGRTVARPLLYVANSDRTLVEQLRAIAGRGVVYVPPRAPRPGWSVIYKYQVSADQARTVLVSLRPYLRVKGEIADLVLSLPRLKGLRGEAYERLYEEMSRVTAQIRARNVRGSAAHHAQQAPGSVA